MKKYLAVLIPLTCLFVFFGCNCSPKHSAGGKQVLEKWKQSRSGHKHVIYDVFFGPDHETVITCGGDIRLFSCPDLELLKSRPSQGVIIDAAISPDRSFIVSLRGVDDFYTIIKTTDLETKRTVHVKLLVPFPALDGSGRMEDRLMPDRVVLADDGSVIVVGSYEISVWDIDGTKEISKVQVQAPATAADTLAIARKAKIVAYSSDSTPTYTGSVINVFDYETKKQLISFPSSTTYKSYVPYCLVFSPDDSYLISGSNDHNITIWDWKKGKIAGTLSGGHRSAVENIKFFPDGRHLASVGSDGFLCIWDFKERKLIAKEKIANEWTYGLDISDDGKMIVTAGGYITLFKVNLP